MLRQWASGKVFGSHEAPLCARGAGAGGGEGEGGNMNEGYEKLRLRCFKDMQRFIENCRKDSRPDVPAYETLTVMLQTLEDCGPEGFGDSDWQKKQPQREQPPK